MAGFFALKRDDVAPLFCKSYLFCFKFEGERKKEYVIARELLHAIWRELQ